VIHQKAQAHTSGEASGRRACHPTASGPENASDHRMLGRATGEEQHVGRVLHALETAKNAIALIVQALAREDRVGLVPRVFSNLLEGVHELVVT
jgi:hypothetical protein